jgi:dolichol kinase
MNHLGRKLFHLLGGLGLLSLYYAFGRKTALQLYGVLAVLVLALEIARLRISAWNRFLYTYFGSFVRENEERRLTGTVPYILGVGLSLWAFSAPAASTAICFLAFGDVAATTIGQRFGRTRIGKKSLEGTVAFVAAALFSGYLLSFAELRISSGIMILGALVAAGVELLPLPLNDNLTIPLIAGAAMELALRWGK